MIRKCIETFRVFFVCPQKNNPRKMLIYYFLVKNNLLETLKNWSFARLNLDEKSKIYRAR